MWWFFKKQKTREPGRCVRVRVEPPGYRAREFVLPASHLASPHFAPLMAKAEEEYGAVIAIPCKLDDFVNAMVNTLVGGAPLRSSPRGIGVTAHDDEPSSPRRRSLGWFLARSH